MSKPESFKCQWLSITDTRGGLHTFEDGPYVVMEGEKGLTFAREIDFDNAKSHGGIVRVDVFPYSSIISVRMYVVSGGGL